MRYTNLRFVVMDSFIGQTMDSRSMLELFETVTSCKHFSASVMIVRNFGIDYLLFFFLNETMSKFDAFRFFKSRVGVQYPGRRALGRQGFTFTSESALLLLNRIGNLDDGIGGAITEADPSSRALTQYGIIGM